MSLDTSEYEPKAIPDLMSVQVDDRGDSDVVTVCGEIDLATGPALRRTLDRRLDAGRTRVVVDLEEVDFIDSTGLGILLETHRRTADRGGSMTVVCRPGLCSRLFEISGLDRVFSFADTVEEAVTR